MKKICGVMLMCILPATLFAGTIDDLGGFYDNTNRGGSSSGSHESTSGDSNGCLDSLFDVACDSCSETCCQLGVSVFTDIAHMPNNKPPYVFRARMAYQGLTKNLWGVAGDARLDFGIPLLQFGAAYYEEADLEQTNSAGARSPDVDYLREYEILGGVGFWTPGTTRWRWAVAGGVQWVTGNSTAVGFQAGSYNEIWFGKQFALDADVAVNIFSAMNKWDFELGGQAVWGHFGFWLGYQAYLYTMEVNETETRTAWLHGARFGIIVEF